MAKYNVHGEYCTRAKALASHPNAIIRKHKVTGFYVCFYDHKVFQAAVCEKLVTNYKRMR